MTHEEMERTMQFILGQQAQFSADIQQIREVQAKFQTQLGTLSDATLTLVGVVGKVVEAQERTDARITEFEERANNKIAELAAAQGRTEERLNVFIAVVERYISGRDGKPKK